MLSSFGLRGDTVLMEFAINRGTGQSESFGGLSFVAAGGLQGVDDGVAFA